MSAPDTVRMWRTYKEAGRPIPRFSDDDYVDYCVIEAISLKVLKEEAKERKAQEREAWKKQEKERLAQAHG